jgi:hypothetical protein
MPINQGEENRQQKWRNFYTTISPKYKIRQKMWEDKATTDPTNSFSEAMGGHKQEGVTNKKSTERIWTEEVKMRRHEKQHANTGE